MAESTTLEEQRSRTLVVPVFLALVGVLVLARGVPGAETSGGRIAAGIFGGAMVLLPGAFAAYLARKAPDRLEVTPEHIVLRRSNGRGTRIGVTPPIVVRRKLVGGANPVSTWYVHDSSMVAVDFVGEEATPRYGEESLVNVDAFGPQAVYEAVQRAGWPSEWRP